MDLSCLHGNSTGSNVTQWSCINVSVHRHALGRNLNRGKPIVAAIHGSCLGGGLETALACRYRIASESPKTVLGLPEVKLGILPGAGGTQRLPALIGVQAALPLMLTGSNVRPAKAKKIKLVDEVADPNALRSAAIQAARELADGKRIVDREPKSIVPRLTKFVLEQTSFGQNMLLKKARESVMKMTHGNYPAPLKIIDVVQTGLQYGFKSSAGYAAETAGFSELGLTPESRALTSIFFGMQVCSVYSKEK